MLIAYARMDAARFDDTEFVLEKSLRKTADPRMGAFLKKLRQVKESRVLVSSRLFPAALETETADPIPGTSRLKLEGLADEDSMSLWQAFDVTGSSDELLPIFNTFDKHPLLIQALAGEVKRFRKNPGNFGEWRKAHQQFDPSKFPRTKEAMDHVLKYALRGLDERAWRVVQIIAAFRMPARYDTLAALTIGKGKTCAHEDLFDKVLTELEDRGIVGWDKRANRYDLHPVVRRLVWSGLSTKEKRDIYKKLSPHFRSLLKIDRLLIKSLDDLTSEIEYFNTLIGLKRYREAYEFWQDNIEVVSDSVLKANRQRITLLEEFFPYGLKKTPKIRDRMSKVITMNSLAISLLGVGDVNSAMTLLNSALEISKEDVMNYLTGILYTDLSNAFRLRGQIYHAEYAIQQAILLFRAEEGHGYLDDECLQSLFLIRMIRTYPPNRRTPCEEMLGTINAAWAYACLAEAALWRSDPEYAEMLADRSLDLWENDRHYERDIIRAKRLQGISALKLNDLPRAEEQLHHALTRARRVSLVDEELAGLVALCELRCEQKDWFAAREILDDLLETAERGPYPLYQADALNMLAVIELSEGHKSAAIEAASRAYQLAWCDGPPFAYDVGLMKALRLLNEIGASKPEMLPFDESKFEPMLRAKIDLGDEDEVFL